MTEIYQAQHNEFEGEGEAMMMYFSPGNDAYNPTNITWEFSIGIGQRTHRNLGNGLPIVSLLSLLLTIIISSYKTPLVYLKKAVTNFPWTNEIFFGNTKNI